MKDDYFKSCEMHRKKYKKVSQDKREEKRES